MTAFLSQGSLFKNRVFLQPKSERTLVKNLLQGNMDLAEFLNSDINSPNGQMILHLVRRLSNQFGEIPREYNTLLRKGLHKATFYSI